MQAIYFLVDTDGPFHTIHTDYTIWGIFCTCIKTHLTQHEYSSFRQTVLNPKQIERKLNKYPQIIVGGYPQWIQLYKDNGYIIAQ